LKWVDESGEKYLNNATINFYLEYFNTPSAKMLRYLFEKLDLFYKKGVKMKIVWHYDSEDEKEEFEHEFANDISLPVQFNKKQE
jgi:hypothetical protein